MSDRWAVKMLEMMNHEETQHFRFGSIVVLEPLTIKVNDVLIKRNIFIDPTLLVNVQQIENDLNQAYGIVPDDTIMCLKKMLMKHALRVGDRVIMLHVDTMFYVLQRLVSI